MLGDKVRLKNGEVGIIEKIQKRPLGFREFFMKSGNCQNQNTFAVVLGAYLR